MLLANSALVNEPNGAGSTPLALVVNSWGSAITEGQMAVAGRMEVAEQLLYAGAPVNQKIGSNGSTALHMAIFYGEARMVEILLDNEADPTLRDNNDSTGFDLARQVLANGKVSG